MSLRFVMLCVVIGSAFGWMQFASADDRTSRKDAIAALRRGKLKLTFDKTGKLERVSTAEGESKITDETLAPLRAFQSVKLLYLSHTDITRAGLEHVKHLPLKRLGLSGTKLTDSGIKTILRFEDLESLDISHTAVSDRGVAQLASLERLSFLSVAGCDISGAGLKPFREHSLLEQLVLSQTEVDDSAMLHVKEIKRL